MHFLWEIVLTRGFKDSERLKLFRLLRLIRLENFLGFLIRAAARLVSDCCCRCCHIVHQDSWIVACGDSNEIENGVNKNYSKVDLQSKLQLVVLHLPCTVCIEVKWNLAKKMNLQRAIQAVRFLRVCLPCEQGRIFVVSWACNTTNRSLSVSSKSAELCRLSFWVDYFALAKVQK